MSEQTHVWVVLTEVAYEGSELDSIFASEHSAKARRDEMQKDIQREFEELNEFSMRERMPAFDEPSSEAVVEKWVVE